MAQQVLVQLIDDLNGTSSGDVATVTFGLDGVDYEIDLSSGNAEAIRSALEPYVSAGRRTGGRLKRGVQSADRNSNPGEAGLIRVWAQENGYDLAARGRIPGEVLEAYKKAQEAPVTKVKGRRAKKS